MQRYQCHKVVEAGKIISIVDLPSGPAGAARLVLAGEKAARVMSPEWMQRHQPEVGGYFVRYEDGYESYSPAAAFEAGYTPIGE